MDSDLDERLQLLNSTVESFFIGFVVESLTNDIFEINKIYKTTSSVYCSIQWGVCCSFRDLLCV